MDVVKEDIEERALYLSTEKREKNIKVYYPRFINNAFWRIAYEDGGAVSDELSGDYTSKQDALKALERWERNTSPTVGARFKGKQPPVLKTKKVRGATDKSAPATDSEAG